MGIKKIFTALKNTVCVYDQAKFIADQIIKGTENAPIKQNKEKLITTISKYIYSRVDKEYPDINWDKKWPFEAEVHKVQKDDKTHCVIKPWIKIAIYAEVVRLEGNLQIERLSCIQASLAYGVSPEGVRQWIRTGKTLYEERGSAFQECQNQVLSLLAPTAAPQPNAIQGFIPSTFMMQFLECQAPAVQGFIPGAPMPSAFMPPFSGYQAPGAQGFIPGAPMPSAFMPPFSGFQAPAAQGSSEYQIFTQQAYMPPIQSQMQPYYGYDTQDETSASRMEANRSLSFTPRQTPQVSPSTESNTGYISSRASQARTSLHLPDYENQGASTSTEIPASSSLHFMPAQTSQTTSQVRAPSFFQIPNLAPSIRQKFNIDTPLNDDFKMMMQTKPWPEMGIGHSIWVEGSGNVITSAFKMEVGRFIVNHCPVDVRSYRYAALRYKVDVSEIVNWVSDASA